MLVLATLLESVVS